MSAQNISLVPAQLWIGPSTHLAKQTEAFLQSLWCTDNGCTTCSVCRGIAQRQHHSVLWIDPQNGYTRDLIEPILQTIRLERTHPGPFFFVLYDVDLLTPTCANMLLKSLEEPPAGYHFLLLAGRAQLVLATIRSRCTVSYKQNTAGQEPSHAMLFRQFTSTTTPAEFLTALEQSKISDHESMELLDALLVFYTHAYQQALIANKDTNHLLHTISLIHTALRTPPASGSSKLFWKNLFLQFFTR